MLKLKSVTGSRKRSVLLLICIYAAAAALGAATYLLIGGDMRLRLLAADAVATVFVFGFSLLFKNASVYDPYWSVQPIVISAVCAYGHRLTLPSVLVLTAVTLWGLRLTANWAYTFKGLDYQDWRYTMLEEKTGKLYFFVNFTGIHMVPTVVVCLCTIPAVLLIEAEAPLNAGNIIGFLISVSAFTLQGAADIQMHRFREKKRGGETDAPFMREGLWKYSRHPNYLGEILMWWGVAVCAVSSMPENWLSAAGALANTCLFLFVSIPLADGRQSRKEGFEAYKRGTRMLLPIKKAAYAAEDTNTQGEARI